LTFFLTRVGDSTSARPSMSIFTRDRQGVTDGSSGPFSRLCDSVWRDASEVVVNNGLRSTFYVYVTYNGVSGAYVIDAHVIEPSILGLRNMSV